MLLYTEVSVDVVYILSTVETENAYTTARLEALFTSSQSSFLTRASQDLKPNFPCERPRSRSIQMFREEICSVAFRVHASHR